MLQSRDIHIAISKSSYDKSSYLTDTHTVIEFIFCYVFTPSSLKIAKYVVAQDFYRFYVGWPKNLVIVRKTEPQS